MPIPAPEKVSATLRCSTSQSGLHHWVLDADKFVPLRGRQAVLYPGCEGRRGVCKFCKRVKIHPERLVDFGTVWDRKAGEV